jgi:hypothetical protein
MKSWVVGGWTIIGALKFHHPFAFLYLGYLLTTLTLHPSAVCSVGAKLAIGLKYSNWLISSCLQKIYKTRVGGGTCEGEASTWTATDGCLLSNCLGFFFLLLLCFLFTKYCLSHVHVQIQTSSPFLDKDITLVWAASFQKKNIWRHIFHHTISIIELK